MKKVLKDDGYLIISTPSRYRFRNIFRVLMGKPVAFMSEFHVTEYSVGQVYEQMKYGGFGVAKTISKPIYESGIIQNIIYRLLENIIKIIGSKHRLESTIFYLCKIKQS